MKLRFPTSRLKGHLPEVLSLLLLVIVVVCGAQYWSRLQQLDAWEQSNRQLTHRMNAISHEIDASGHVLEVLDTVRELISASDAREKLIESTIVLLNETLETRLNASSVMAARREPWRELSARLAETTAVQRDSRVPLYTIALNDFEALLRTARMFRAESALTKRLHLVVLDMTGCELVAASPVPRRQRLDQHLSYAHSADVVVSEYEKLTRHEVMRDVPLSQGISCAAWNAVKTLIAFWGVATFVDMETELLFGQLHRFATRHALALGHHRFILAHSDTLVATPAAFLDLASIAMEAPPHFCLTLTEHDSLAVYNADALLDDAMQGGMDERLWYFADRDLHWRCVEAGFPLLSFPAFKELISHPARGTVSLLGRLDTQRHDAKFQEWYRVARAKWSTRPCGGLDGARVRYVLALKHEAARPWSNLTRVGLKALSLFHRGVFGEFGDGACVNVAIFAFHDRTLQALASLTVTATFPGIAAESPAASEIGHQVTERLRREWDHDGPFETIETIHDAHWFTNLN